MQEKRTDSRADNSKTTTRSGIREEYELQSEVNPERSGGGGLEAIILAAGTGSRLESLTAEFPKCLVRVGNRSLLDHQLDMLEKAGIDRVTVVTGYCAESVENELDGRAETLFNPVWSQTNSLYSLWLCRERVNPMAKTGHSFQERWK